MTNTTRQSSHRTHPRLARLAVLALALGTLSAAGCHRHVKKTPAEKAGDKIENAGDKIEDKLDEAN